MNHNYKIAGKSFTSNAATENDLAKEVVDQLIEHKANCFEFQSTGSAFSEEDDVSIDIVDITAHIASEAASRKNFHMGQPINPVNGIDMSDVCSAKIDFEKGSIFIEGSYEEDSPADFNND